MKRLLSLLLALMLLLPYAALAKADESPLLILFDAEKMLLFHTGNVTMTGHAVFSLDGEVFKTADLTHIQCGSRSMRDWRLETPQLAQDGVRSSGYTVVTADEMVYAMESRGFGYIQHYYVSPEMQRHSVLRHTVAGDALMQAADLALSQFDSFGQIAASIDENDCRTITVSITEQDVPPLMQSMLNLLLQYGISRYKQHDYSTDPLVHMGECTGYSTITEGLVSTLSSVMLQELQLTADLDDYGRLTDLQCSIALRMTEKASDHQHTIRAELTQQARDFGCSTVSDDLQEYNHWAQEVLLLPPVDAAAQQDRAYIEECHVNTKGTFLLHTSIDCRRVASPITIPYDPDLLLTYQLCPACCIMPEPTYTDTVSSSQLAAAADLIAEAYFSADYGLTELYERLLAERGPFAAWPAHEKYLFTELLPALLCHENARLAAHQHSQSANQRYFEQLCAMHYAYPGIQSEDVALLKAYEYAIQVCGLTMEQLDQSTVTCDYYRGCKFTVPFDEPCWAVRFTADGQVCCEVWMNKSMTSAAGQYYPGVEAKAREAFFAADPKLAGRPVTEAMLSSFDSYTIYLMDSQQWLYAIDSSTGSSWTILLDDTVELPVVSIEASNG